MKYASLALTANLIIAFIRRTQEYKIRTPNLGTMFFLPYLRIIPMHFMILIPAFLNLKPALIFLVLKGIFDLVGHVIVTGWYWVKEGQEPKESFA